MRLSHDNSHRYIFKIGLVAHDNYHRHIFKTSLDGPLIVPSKIFKDED